ncbi:dTDP-4-dehydrorhamnose 3,5-epimerase [Herbaspirillum sp. ST 5-3]|uniref:dTDP-4-dehydrorhamnose 3,5-epimerase n=1 Tax=Oxalobacteraceae TaxID=75682 RepID=UPI0010A58FA6|nr:dTDP-4-dehydrorhamnose 3,5-epimerase [Herbaspirillum sp. ST 5-3]
MKFTPLRLSGAFLIEPEPLADERGFFSRTFCAHEFAEHGLETSLVQCSISYNKLKGTLRGMHYQKSPHEEAKLVRCTMGAIHDVIVDLRPDSPTCRQWTAVELNAENRSALYVPKGFAHGFLTLVDDTEVFYQMSAFFHAECAAGVRWNDPVFAIDWPAQVQVISSRDNSYPGFDA